MFMKGIYLLALGCTALSSTLAAKFWYQKNVTIQALVESQQHYAELVSVQNKLLLTADSVLVSVKVDPKTKVVYKTVAVCIPRRKSVEDNLSPGTNFAFPVDKVYTVDTSIRSSLGMTLPALHGIQPLPKRPFKCLNY